MEKEASDEFLVFQSHIDGIACAIVPGREDSMGLRDRSDAGICDGDAVGITAEIVDGIAETIEGLFDERAPVLKIELIDKTLPGDIIQEIIRQRQNAGIMKSLEMKEELSSELARQDFDRDKERPAAFLKLKIGR